MFLAWLSAQKRFMRYSVCCLRAGVPTLQRRGPGGWQTRGAPLLTSEMTGKREWCYRPYCPAFPLAPLSFYYSFAYSLTYPLADSLTHSLIHSLIHVLAYLILSPLASSMTTHVHLFLSLLRRREVALPQQLDALPAGCSHCCVGAG